MISCDFMCIYIYRCTYSITIKEETPQHTHCRWLNRILLKLVQVQRFQRSNRWGVMSGGHSQVLRSNLHWNLGCLQWGIRSHLDLLGGKPCSFHRTEKKTRNTSTWGAGRSEVLIGWSKSSLNNMSSGIFGWYCWWKKSQTATWDSAKTM